MKQILQNLKDGTTEVTDVPVLSVEPGTLLIRSSHSVISSGTERILQDFGRANWVSRALQQPDKVKMVIDKARTDGLLTTIAAVKSKLDDPVPLGYCNVGTLMEVGAGIQDFPVGERVVSNGPHAEVVRVPRNLCARVPENVDDESAAFTPLAAIALHSVRLAQASIGESVVVIGLGLVGLLSVQILRAQGCRVLGVDYNSDRLAPARQFGAETVDLSSNQDPQVIAGEFSRGLGVDAVIIAASTESSDPVSQAAKMCRKRGRIVLVGVTGLELSRADFYEKELTFQVSCSYGPGRYDTSYEEKGQDYPVGYVRWTEQRNFEAVLNMMADGRLDTRSLVTHHFSIEDAADAYELLGSEKPYLGIVLDYPASADHSEYPSMVDLGGAAVPKREGSNPVDPVTVGFIGAGNYAGRTLMPAFKKAGAVLHTVASSGGVSAVRSGKKFGFQHAVTDPEHILSQPDINSIVIATRHNSHAGLVCAALRAGKNVFVEKPLALTLDELEEIREAWEAIGIQEDRPIVMVGFNRRFAPHIKKIKTLLATAREPKTFIMTVNAGSVPPDHWVQDLAIGGGRILGEACHFIDLLRFLADAPMTGHHAEFIAGSSDTVSISLRFEDGSLGTIHYLANGSKAFPKERLEVFCYGRILQLDNFRRLKGYGWTGFKSMNLVRQDKGQTACVASFIEAVQNGVGCPIGIAELFEVSRLSIIIAQGQ